MPCANGDGSFEETTIPPCEGDTVPDGDNVCYQALVDDAMVAGLRHHFSDADVVAIMFHLALSDGFAKLGHAMGAPAGDAA